jgi:acyl carrier protein
MEPGRMYEIGSRKWSENLNFKVMEQKKDAFWFSHDSNAKDDPKCMLLIDQLGLEGYGIYWLLVETLRDQPDYKYPLVLLPVLGKRYQTSAEKMKAVVLNYELFQIENDKFFFSPSLNNRMKFLEKKREQASLAGKKSAEKRKKLNGRSTDVQRTLNSSSTNNIKNNTIQNNTIQKKGNVNINDNSTRLDFDFDSIDFINLYKYIQKSVNFEISKEELIKSWENFKHYCIAGGDTNKTKNAYYKHFLNWLKKQTEYCERPNKFRPLSDIIPEYKDGN